MSLINKNILNSCVVLKISVDFSVTQKCHDEALKIIVLYHLLRLFSSLQPGKWWQQNITKNVFTIIISNKSF
jgi:hypothetical protein